MKKWGLIFFLSFSLSCPSLYGQDDYDRIAADLINRQQWFDLKELFDEHRDRLGDFMERCSSAYIHTYFNAPRLAIEDWNALVAGYSDDLDGQQILGFRFLLLTLYEEVQEYEKAVELCDILLDSGIDPDLANFIRSRKAAFQEFAKFPPIRVHATDEAGAVIDLVDKRSDDFMCLMEWNGKSIPTLFDTGAGASIMHRDVAESIGVRYLSAEPVQLNRAMTGVYGMVDSLRTTGLTLYNVPVIVYTEQIAPDEGFDEAREQAGEKLSVVFGLPLIKLFEEIQISLSEGRIHIPFHSSTVLDAGSKTPVAIINNSLYLKQKINGMDFTCWVDTGLGNEDLIIYNGYYEENHEHLPLAGEDVRINRILGMGGVSQWEYYTPRSIRMEVGGTAVDLPHPIILTDNVNNTGNFIDPHSFGDGILGADIFGKVNQVVFNFDEMWCVFK